MRLILVAALALAAATTPEPEDVLGELVVEASSGKRAPLRLLKVGLKPVQGDDREAARAGEVIRRDFELSGEVELVDPDEPNLDAVVQVRVRRTGKGATEIGAELYLREDLATPAFESSVAVPHSHARAHTHRLVDKLLGALTGYDGPFESRLTFVRTFGGSRSVYVVDADGHNLREVSAPDHLATAPAFGPDDTVYYAASVDRGRYRLFRARSEEPIRIAPEGSIYGIAFSEDRRRVALSIATESGVRLFTGPSDFSDLQARASLPLTLHPAFSPLGGIAYAGTTKTRQRIYVDGKAVSPRGVSASSPTYCRHPDGLRLAYSVGVRESADIVVADARGRDPVRVTASAGRNSAPACSPDGRLIAFFSTRRSGEGPGLYVMRADGRRQRKISGVLGDSLRWGRVRAPAPSAPSRPLAGSNLRTDERHEEPAEETAEDPDAED